MSQQNPKTSRHNLRPKPVPSKFVSNTIANNMDWLSHMSNIVWKIDFVVTIQGWEFSFSDKLTYRLETLKYRVCS